MTRSMTNLFRLSIGTVLGAAVLLWNGQLLIDPQTFALVSSAEARVGRPLTPMSYAGVARRTTRRAVAVGAVATGVAVVAAPVVVAPACAQVVGRPTDGLPPSADREIPLSKAARATMLPHFLPQVRRTPESNVKSGNPLPVG